jgi:hypothetical protein
VYFYVHGNTCRDEGLGLPCSLVAGTVEEDLRSIQRQHPTSNVLKQVKLLFRCGFSAPRGGLFFGVDRDSDPIPNVTDTSDT